MTRACIAVTLLLLSFGVPPWAPPPAQGQCQYYLDNYRFETAFRNACPFVDGCLEVREPYDLVEKTIDNPADHVDLRGRAVVAVLEDHSTRPPYYMSKYGYYYDGAYEPTCPYEAYAALTSETASPDQAESVEVDLADPVMHAETATEEVATTDGEPWRDEYRYDTDYRYDYDYGCYGFYTLGDHAPEMPAEPHTKTEPKVVAERETSTEPDTIAACELRFSVADELERDAASDTLAYEVFDRDTVVQDLQVEPSDAKQAAVDQAVVEAVVEQHEAEVPNAGVYPYYGRYPYGYPYHYGHGYGYRHGYGYGYGYGYGHGCDDDTKTSVVSPATTTPAESNASADAGADDAASPVPNCEKVDWHQVWVSGYGWLTSLRDAVDLRDRLTRALDRLDARLGARAAAELRAGLAHVAATVLAEPADRSEPEFDANVFLFAFELAADPLGLTGASWYETPWLMDEGANSVVVELSPDAESPHADAEAIGLEMARDAVSAVLSIDRQQAMAWLTQTWGQATAMWSEVARRLQHIDRQDVATAAGDDAGATTHR